MKESAERVAQFENRLLIGGRLVGAQSGKSYASINPANGQVLGEVADASPADMSAAIGHARQAFDETDWSRNAPFRQRCLQQLQDAIRANATVFRDILILDSGMTWSAASALVESVTNGMSFMIELCGSYAYERRYKDVDVGASRQARRILRRPFGVAGLITTWNAPFLVNVWKLTPTLASGNAAVLKASPLAPYTALLLGRLVKEATDIPAGIVNVLSSGDRAEVGEALTGDPRVDMFSFTGSSRTGARVMERAAQGIRKVELELSGKSANLILEDANLDVALPFSASMACMLSGQGCALPTRLLVHDRLYDEAIDRLKQLFDQVRLGDPFSPDTTMGPVISSEQQSRIFALIEEGKRQCRLVRGGGIPALPPEFQRGFWVEPTLFADVAPDAVIAQREIFGPVLSVIRFRSDDEAVRIANGTEFGLAAYIQTADTERALRLAPRLRAGGVGLNGTVAFSHPDIPFGGVGVSGLGRKNGVEGFEEYLQTMVIVEPAGPARPAA